MLIAICFCMIIIPQKIAGIDDFNSLANTSLCFAVEAHFISYLTLSHNSVFLAAYCLL